LVELWKEIQREHNKYTKNRQPQQWFHRRSKETLLDDREADTDFCRLIGIFCIYAYTNIYIYIYINAVFCVEKLVTLTILMFNVALLSFIAQW
jgi:hypothetical protein